MFQRFKIISVILLLAVFCACAPKDNHVSQPPISRDTFQKLLFEMHYTDAALQPFTVNKDSVWKEVWRNYKGIFEKHHITYPQFKQTYMFYCYHSKDLDDMYQKMLDNISMQQAQLQKK